MRQKNARIETIEESDSNIEFLFDESAESIQLFFDDLDLKELLKDRIRKDHNEYYLKGCRIA